MLTKQYLLAISVVIATIIGGGIFALPYAFAQAGFWPSAVVFALLTAVNVVVMLMFGEVVLRTPGTKRQFPGYAGIYLGKFGKLAMLGVQIIGNFGAMLIFIIGVGGFLSGLFAADTFADERIWGLIFFAVAAVLVILGISTVARVQFVFSLLFIVLLLIITMAAWPHVDWSNLATVDLAKIMMPFGVIIFALSGISAVPLLDDMFPKNRAALKPAIIWGVIIAALVSFIFAAAILGLGGAGVTEDSLGTVQRYLPSYVSLVMAIFGIVAMGTTFLTTGIVMREMFEYDYKMPKVLAFALVLVIPLILYLLNLTGFVAAISFVGAITGGLGAILSVWMYLRARRRGTKEPEYQIKFPWPVSAGVIAVYVAAIIWEIFIILK